jgi:branched-chain amino acid transport system ATP-binding protein
MDGVDITRAPVHRRAALGLARSYQITAVFDELTVLENVMLATQGRTGHCFQFIRAAANDARVSAAARHAIELVGLAAFADCPAADLSHGAKRQLELAMAVSLRPRILLLDEPMAGTGSAESREMVELLRRLRTEAAIVLVEHDLEAVFALADRISVLVYGKVIATGAAQDIRSNALVREAYIGEGEEVI